MAEKTFASADARPPRRLGNMYPTTIAAWAVFVGSCIVALLAASLGIPVKELVRDASTEFDVPIYGGIFTTISFATLVLAGGFFLFTRPHATGPLKRLATAGAALTLFMAMDDVLMLHEEFGPRVGIIEEAFYFVYWVVAMYIYWQIRRIGDRRLLSAAHTAAGFLCVSALTDITSVHGPFSFWLEDFTKLAGFAGIAGVAAVAARFQQAAPQNTD